MFRSRTIVTATLVAGITIVGLTGCADDTAAKEAEACDAYSSFTEAVDQARKTLTGQPTVADLRDARDNVQAKYEVLENRLDAVNTDRQKDLKDSVKDFNSAVDKLDDSSSIPDAVRSLSDQFGKVAAAELAVSSDLDCKTES